LLTIEIIQTLVEVSDELLSTHDTDHLLNKIIALLSELVAFNAAAIHMVQGDQLYTRVAIGQVSSTVGQYNLCRKDDFIWQYLDQERKPYVWADAHQQEQTLHIGQANIRSFLAAPLASNGKLLGILTLDHQEPHQFGQTEVEIVRLFANC